MKLKELRTILKTQKYPQWVTEKGIENTLSIPQEEFRNEKLKNSKDVLLFASTYNPNNSNVLPKVKEIDRNF